jgi:hypothetical protein
MKKKLYFIIPVLIIILLISFSALCNLGGEQTVEEVADDQISEDNEKQEEVKKEQDQSDKDPDSSEGSSDIENKEKTKDDDSKSSQPSNGINAPTISMKIYEGPTYSQADDICYYRIEAITTGNPEPSIKFNRDDSNGAWGKNRVQVNIQRGETYTLTATATNSEGSATDSIKLDWGCNDTNHNPEIAGIGLSANELYTLTEYEISTAATDPDGDNLTYKWSVDGGTLKSSTSNPTKWETPGFPETYHITVEVSDGRGGTATETRAVRVEEIVIIGDNPPQVHNIIINDSPIFTNTKYYVYGDVSDPDNDLQSFHFDVSGGTLSEQDANDIYWTTPVDAGDYSISLLARDQEGNEDLLVVFFTVETEWIVVD